MLRAGLALIAIVLGGSASFAQSAFERCEPAPDWERQIEKAQTRGRDPKLPFSQRINALQRLIDQDPSDVFANRAYLSWFRGYSKLPLASRLVLPRYEREYKQNPADSAKTYLYALSIARRDSAKADALFGQLIREQPQSPWPYLSISESQLEQFFTLCPDSLDSEALDRLSSSGSPELKHNIAERLRRQLTDRADALALSRWPALWQLEFQTTPNAESDRLRERIRGDLAKLRNLATSADEVRLETLLQGYPLVQDHEGRNWAQQEAIRRYPRSRLAADATVEQWNERNPVLARDAPIEEQEALERKRLSVAATWLAQWPNFEPACMPFVWLMTSKLKLPQEEVASMSTSALACADRNPDYTFGFVDVPLLAVAERQLRANVEVASIPDLVARAQRRVQQRTDVDLATVPHRFSEAQIRANEQIERWHARRITALYHWRMQQKQSAMDELEVLQKEVGAHSGGNDLAIWRGFTTLAETAVDLGRSDVARETVARMGAALATDRPANRQTQNEHDLHESERWRLRALLADAEGRKPDAVSFLLRAAHAAPPDYAPGDRAQLMGDARAAWAALGGSVEALDALNAPTETNNTNRWTAINKPMPELPGESFKARITFLNVWATWCGPCQAELPLVQRIYEAVKDKRGVRILTLNIDENPGLIGAYMQEHRFTFPVISAREYVEQQMKVDGIPRNWVVDTNGMLRLESSVGVSEAFVSDVLAVLHRFVDSETHDGW